MLVHMQKYLFSILFLIVAPLSLIATELIVDTEGSSVRVDVKASPPHSFTCDLQQYDASIDVDSSTGEINSAQLTFQLTDLETHNDKRNKKMLNWMDVEKFNTIRWTMTSVEEIDGQTVALGEMTMHGVTMAIDIPFTLSIAEGSYTLTGSVDFDYMSFDLPKIRLFLFTVKPNLHVNFTLRGALASAK